MNTKDCKYIAPLLDSDEKVTLIPQKDAGIFHWFCVIIMLFGIGTFIIFILFEDSVIQQITVSAIIIFMMYCEFFITVNLLRSYYLTNKKLIIKIFNKVKTIPYEEIKSIKTETSRGTDHIFIKTMLNKTEHIIFVDGHSLKEHIETALGNINLTPPPATKREKIKEIFLCLLIIACYALYKVDPKIPTFLQKAENKPTIHKEKILQEKDPSSKYMQIVTEKIKKNWKAPKNDSSCKVVALFTIDPSGNLVKSNVNQSSCNLKTDQSALKAIAKSSPFPPVPKELKAQNVDILFTFEYNIIND